MYRLQLVLMICIHIAFIFCVSKCQGTIASDSNPKLANQQLNKNETEAIEFLNQFNKRAEIIYHQESLAEWNFYINITQHNKNLLTEAKVIKSDFTKEARNNASQFDWSRFSPYVSRQLDKVLHIGDAALTDDKFKEFTEILGTMQYTFTTADVCKPDGECLNLEPDLYNILAYSRNYDDVVWAWKAWRDAVGPGNLDNYAQYVELKNKAAFANDQPDWGAFLRSAYEQGDFEQKVDLLYEQLQPLYQHLHAYVRRKLYNVYGSDYVNLRGPIPVPITGNMWAQDWAVLLDICLPYPDKPTVDSSEVLKRKNFTALKLFQAAEEFFLSLGLLPMPQEFWNISIIEKPNDNRIFQCHAKAQDFYNRRDFGIKMCTEINQAYFNIIHHEMGHTQYHLHYKHLPVLFREGANPGFHEAVGDVIALSVNTPQHLQSVGLLDEVVDDPESDLNFLMNMALDKIVFLPFGLLVDKWRWAVFDGRIPKSSYNEEWWNLRLKYQGVIPPISRAPEDFDPASKLHVVFDVPYLAYFVSKILEFQLHDVLCNASGHTGPLYKCDIYGSKEAGRILAQMLREGSSKPWPDVLESVTGQRTMDARPLVRYFEPLMEYLIEENEKNGEVLGWPDTDWMPRESFNLDCCQNMAQVTFPLAILVISLSLVLCVPREVPRSKNVRSPMIRNNNEDDAKAFLDSYNTMAMDVYYKDVLASWNYQTDITEENQQKMIEQSLISAAFQQEARANASEFDRDGFTEDTVRQLEDLLYIGDSALEDPQDLQDLNDVLASMETRYSTGEVCLDDDDCYSLEPGLTRILAESRNYAELYWAWDGWRDAVGGPAREDYKEYVRLKNLAAVANDQPDQGAYWRSWYEVEDLEAEVLKLYNQLKPFYQQLHAYVRRKLYNVYGSKYINLEGPIPAHLLGNMWAQSWLNLLDICEPFPEKPDIDITPALREKGYDALKMFQTSDEFFASLGLKEMPQEFWDHSMIEKPTDREVVCHASAWDFYNQKDFRVKQCTDITQDDFITVHHEMGHIEYYLQYKNLPVVYRGGANPGFHEAVGDVLALSVSTPQHLHDIGLLDEIADDPDADINYLMSIALDKIAFLPFAILMDQWRWGLFDGSTQDAQFNQEWWQLRLDFQGLVPPTARSESDFDPAAKYHIPSDTPYIRYFISHILQFQFHEAMCNASGHTGPLLKCDIYKSHEAGKLLGDMLSLGSSVPWPDAMEKITGQREMSAEPLVKYFQPLMDWLEKENADMGETIGWPDSDWMPDTPPDWPTPTEPPATTAGASSMAASLAIIIVCIFLFMFR
ncbi:angiotensin-converting enzyme-like [Amphiura filiformis]|uniref:angiotensin-converting enzyme-like n=1 Tax=Amphiura filiformis TaxID=82378 RepID=UPI003B20CD63